MHIKPPQLKFVFFLILSIAVFSIFAVHEAKAINYVSTPYAWITNFGAGTVTKIRVSDGAVIGTYSAGSSPWGVAVDISGNIWVTNNSSRTITKLDSSGNIIGTYSVGISPSGIAIDKNGNIWITNQGSHNVMKIRSSDGVIIGTYSTNISPLTGTYPHAIAVDKDGNIWVACASSYLIKLDSNGNTLGTFTAGDQNPEIAIDADSVFITNWGPKTVTRLDYSGTLKATYNLPGYTRHVAVDASGNVWVANQGGVTKIKKSDGAVIGTYPAGTTPTAVDVDASGNVWVVDAYGYYNLYGYVTKFDSNGNKINTYSVGKDPRSLGDFTGFALQYFVLGYSLQTAPGAPTGLTATVVNNGQINLSWTAPNDGGSAITDYKFEITKGCSGGGCGIWYQNTGSNTITYNLSSNFDTGVQYNFRVAAINSIGTGGYSNYVYVTPAPTNLTASPGNNRITLNWSPPSGVSGISNYKVYRSTTSGTETLLTSGGCSGLGNVLTCTDTGLTNGTSYYYKVSCVSISYVSNNNGSYFSNEVSAIPTITAPDAPTNLTFATGSSQVVLNWSAPASDGGSAITGYKVYRSITSGAETLLTTLGNVLTYANTGLTNGTKYYYKVSAVNNIGEGDKSDEISATPSVPPTKPLSFRAMPGNSRIILNWSAPSGSTVTSYKVYRSTTSGAENLLTSGGCSGLGKVLTCTDIGLSNGTQYYYKVSAVNGTTVGALSSEASATPAQPPDAPTNLKATAVSYSQINLSWTAPYNGGSTITLYEFQRAVVVGSCSQYGIDWSDPIPTGSNSPVFSDRNLDPATTYCYRVRALNDADVYEGPGNWSSAASATTEVPVVQPFSINPSSATLVVGGSTQRLSARPVDQYGNAFQGTITWTSSNTNVATVSSTGLVTSGNTAGTAQITASLREQSAQATITVINQAVTTITLSPSAIGLRINGTQQLAASAFDQNGNPMTAAPSFTWRSSNTGIATVNNSGLVKLISIGTATITASANGVSAIASVTYADCGNGIVEQGEECDPQGGFTGEKGCGTDPWHNWDWDKVCEVNGQNGSCKCLPLDFPYGALCSAGNAYPSSPTLSMAAGSTVTWTCNGINGTSANAKSVTCSANRAGLNMLVNCSSSPSNIIAGVTPVTWTATTPVGGYSGSYKYTWSGTDGLSGNTQSVQKTYSTAGRKEATIKVESPAASPKITANAICPAASVSSSTLTASCSVSPSSAIANTNVTWTATASGGNGTYTYKWTNGTGNNLPTTTSNPTTNTTYTKTTSYSSNGTYEASITVKSGGQTASADCDNSVEVGPVSASCSGSPSIVNVGEEVTWTAAADGGTGSYTYSWSGTDSLSGDTSSVLWHYQTTGQKTASVTVTSGGKSVIVNCSMQVVTSHPTATEPDTTFVYCSTPSVFFNWTYNNSDNAYTETSFDFQIALESDNFNSDGTCPDCVVKRTVRYSAVPGTRNSQYVFIGSRPGDLSYDTTYYWRAIVHDNHGKTASTDIQSFKTDEHAYPCPAFTLSPSTATLTNGSATISFNNESQCYDKDSAGNACNTYNWDFGDGSSISHDENPSHDYKSIGVKNIVLTAIDADGHYCKISDTVTIVNPMGVPEWKEISPF